MRCKMVLPKFAIIVAVLVTVSLAAPLLEPPAAKKTIPVEVAIKQPQLEIISLGTAEKPAAGKSAPAKLAPEKPPIEIISQESDQDPTGKYHYSYEASDGSKAQQDGEQKTIDKEQGATSQGGFEFKIDDQVYKVQYIADENGYQPVGDHLPVAPPIPPLIARSLEYLATAPPPKEEKQ